LTIFSIKFSINLINKSEFSWKTRNCLDDPKLLNGSVFYNFILEYTIVIPALFVVVLAAHLSSAYLNAVQ